MPEETPIESGAISAHDGQVEAEQAVEELAETVTQSIAQQSTLYHLVIFQFGRASDPLSSMTSGLMESVLNKIRAIPTPPNQTSIDIWIESPGGSANVVYKIFLGLRHRCSTLRIVVPDYAKSAATLLALGTDKIFMAPEAELGPLDVQLPHPDLMREGESISGLDQSDLLRFLGRQALDLALRSGIILRANTQLPTIKVMPEAMAFTAKLLAPVFEKLDPVAIHQAAQWLQITQHYAHRMIERRKVDDEFRLSKEQVDNLLRALIEAYPEHGCIIDRQEAADLGLPIANAEEHPRWIEINSKYQDCQMRQSNLIQIYKDSDFGQNQATTSDSE